MINANLKTALLWASLGVSPIPASTRSKIPIINWRIWQYRVPPRKIIEYWFRDKTRNIGVICGGQSNLCIIDFDDINYYHVWRNEHEDDPGEWGEAVRNTYIVNTPRGVHMYIRTLQPENSRKYSDTKIDIRCNGNFTLVPPSTHPCGKKYKSVGNIEDIVTISSLESMFPDPIQQYVSASPSQPDRELDIFDLADRMSINDIISSVDILTFVSKYSKPIKKSTDGRWWYAKCIHPSHKDNHPSFRIDTQKQRAKCMSSSCALYHPIGYDVIDLYKIISGVTTSVAIRDLSRM